MAEQAPIIIKKKKGGGHGGHHGGAWKVAYADFVTAMMCFFLVMWLMGSDDETKAAIEHYFNHPNTPYKSGKDPSSSVVNPMGEKDGQGESIMPGLAGLWPADLLDRPAPVQQAMREQVTIAKLIEDLLDGQVYGLEKDTEQVRFSLPEYILFEEGSSQLNRDAKKTLDILGQVLHSFKGYLTIVGHTDERPKNTSYSSNWELSFGRAVTVMNYLVSTHKLDESHITPMGMGSRKTYTKAREPASAGKNRRVEFVLSYDEKVN